MDQKLETDLLNNAIEIGEEIIRKALVDSNGIYWRTVKSITAYDDITTSVDESLYNGVSGILLFYVELYKATKSEIYLDYIDSSAEWLIKFCSKTPPLHGFYSGRMGTVFALLKIAEIHKKNYYQKKAIGFAIHFKSILTVPVDYFNLCNGLAGTIFGLLHLHMETAEPWILHSINQGVDYLTKNAKSNGIGFFWDMQQMDSSSKSTKPLCSMPLGSSGVGLLFLNLSRYFNNPKYLLIANQAFLYEDQYFNERSKGWPDFRVDLKAKNLKKLRKSYIRCRFDQFFPEKENSSWMFGSIGLAFSRLQDQKLSGDGKGRDKLRHLLNLISWNKTKDNLTNNTLATGRCGLGLFLLELSIEKNNNAYFEIACGIAESAIELNRVKGFYQFGFDSKKEYEDDSLLMGCSGIGYFYLKLLNKSNGSVLFPSLVNPLNEEVISVQSAFKNNDPTDAIFKTWYPGTITILERSKLHYNTRLEAVAIKKSLNDEIEQLVEQSNDAYLRDAFKYEYRKQQFQELVSANYCLFSFSKDFEILKNTTLLEDKANVKLTKTFLKLSQYVKLTACEWDWTNFLVSDTHVGSATYFLFGPDGNEYSLSEVQYLILDSFKNPKRVKNIINSLIHANYFKDEDPDYVTKGLLNVIKSFIQVGILNVTPNRTVYTRYFHPLVSKRIEDIILER